MTSEAGAMLLGTTDKQIRLVERFAGCFTDYCVADLVEHTRCRAWSGCVFGIALQAVDPRLWSRLMSSLTTKAPYKACPGRRPGCTSCCVPIGLCPRGADGVVREQWRRLPVRIGKDTRLNAEIEAELAAAQAQSQETAQPARRFKDFTWQTRRSWSRERRVVANAEWTRGEANPRFVVTSLAREEQEARHL
jgi:hypothetical protein